MNMNIFQGVVRSTNLDDELTNSPQQFTFSFRKGWNLLKERLISIFRLLLVFEIKSLIASILSSERTYGNLV